MVSLFARVNRLMDIVEAEARLHGMLPCVPGRGGGPAASLVVDRGAVGGTLGGGGLIARLAVAVESVKHQPVLVEVGRGLLLLAPPACLHTKE